MNKLVLVLDGEEEQELVLDGEEELELVLEDATGAYVPIYDGEYMVIPRLTEQVLETSGKKMADDVTVKEIPVTYTTNPYNGKTVLIG